MVINMKATGKITLQMDRVGSITQMDQSMKVRFKNLLFMIGSWENDKANGYGVFTHANGSKYQGEWKDDK